MTEAGALAYEIELPGPRPVRAGIECGRALYARWCAIPGECGGGLPRD